MKKKLIYFNSSIQVARNLDELLSKMPKYGLRTALYKISATPECFFALRNNFSKNLAAMCIAHWLLGIGDRHLGNFLIDKSNGQLIGIDFDLAFGAGTRDSHFPELVPFRLSAQFVNVSEPLGVNGFLTKCMAHVLKFFRVEKQSLMAILEAIIYDPAIHGRKMKQASSSSDDFVENDIWEPKNHLEAIQDKLSGINPLIPIEQDLDIRCCGQPTKIHKLVLNTKKTHFPFFSLN